MPELFTHADMERLAAPNVMRAWFLETDLPSGRSFLWNGVGNITLEGQEWRGVSDPYSGRFVSFSGLERARFGQAPAVQILLSGANIEFVRSVRRDAREIEGKEGFLSFRVFDAETVEPLTDLKRMFTGYISAPFIDHQSIGVRTVGITIEGDWNAKNFPGIERWSPAGQRLRHPGDEGLDLLGLDTTETYK